MRKGVFIVLLKWSCKCTYPHSCLMLGTRIKTYHDNFVHVQAMVAWQMYSFDSVSKILPPSEIECKSVNVKACCTQIGR